jgi:hypothetical protein
VVSKRRRVLFNVAEHAVERAVLETNPEKAANVANQNLALPSESWGQIYLEVATPDAGSAAAQDSLAGEGGTVPSPPELTTLLHAHIAEFGTGPDGRLFVGERAGDLPTYMRTWRAARAATFAPGCSAPLRTRCGMRAFRLGPSIAGIIRVATGQNDISPSTCFCRLEG